MMVTNGMKRIAFSVLALASIVPLAAVPVLLFVGLRLRRLEGARG